MHLLVGSNDGDAAGLGEVEETRRKRRHAEGKRQGEVRREEK